MENKKMQQLSAVQLNTGHGAQGAFAGYHYQWFYFMLRMLKMNEKGEAVDFEVRDDVGADVNGNLTFYQLKHTISKNKKGWANLTTCDPDLWKSISVWIDIISKYVEGGVGADEIFAKSEFTLVTNKKVQDNDFCKFVEEYKNDDVTIDEIKSYVSELKSKLRDPEPKENDNPKENRTKKYMDKAIQSEYFPCLLKNLRFVYLNDEELIEDLKFQVGHRAVPKEHIDNALKAIIGSVEIKLYPIIQNGEKLSISIDEFDKLILTDLAQFRGLKFVPKYKTPINMSSKKLSEQVFIKQLIAVKDLTENDSEEIVNITQQTVDYIASELYSVSNHTLSHDSIKALYRNAYTFWHNKFIYCYKFVNKDSEKEVLQAAANLLDNIRSKSDLKIGNDSLGDYLSNGLFYKMSDTSIQKDGHSIGWHPKWNELFNCNNNGESIK